MRRGLFRRSGERGLNEERGVRSAFLMRSEEREVGSENSFGKEASCILCSPILSYAIL